jgi:capsular exopolysaccharide synthesis family protein
MRDIIVTKQPKSPVSEAYRAIRTNLGFANVDKSYKTILVTSPKVGDGKTTTLCNLAMAFAIADYRVLVVDTDLRRPRLHKFMQISNKRGLTDILLNGDDYKNYIYTSMHPNLDMITSGNIPNHPSEILSSKAMKSFVDSIKADYDYVFFDTPPVIPVNDAVILSTFIDRVLLVIGSGEVEKEIAVKAVKSLEDVGAHFLGVVLNKVPINKQKYNYYYYYNNDKREK